MGILRRAFAGLRAATVLVQFVLMRSTSPEPGPHGKDLKRHAEHRDEEVRGGSAAAGPQRAPPTRALSGRGRHNRRRRGVGPRRPDRRGGRLVYRRCRRREVRQGRCAMSNLARRREGQPGSEKLALGIVGALAVVATGARSHTLSRPRGSSSRAAGRGSSSGRPRPGCCACGSEGTLRTAPAFVAGQRKSERASQFAPFKFSDSQAFAFSGRCEQRKPIPPRAPRTG